MANGRSQRVDSASTETRRPRAPSPSTCRSSRSSTAAGTGTTSIAGDDDVVVESAEWTAEVPEDRAEHGTVDIAITTMNRPDFCAKLLGQIGDDDDLRPYLDTVFVMEQGTDKVTDSPDFAEGRERAGRHAAGHRAGQPRRLRRLRPRPARVGPQGHRDLRDDDGRRRRLRARGHHPRGHLRRPRPPPHDRRRPHVQPLLPLAAAQLRRDRPAVALLVAVARSTRYSDWDFAARNLRSSRWLHKRDRRRLQRLVHVPDPAPGARARSGCRCRSSSSGTTPSSACAPRRPATRR